MESDKNKASYTVVYKLHRQMRMELVCIGDETFDRNIEIAYRKSIRILVQ